MNHPDFIIFYFGGTLKRVVWYFEESCVLLWRGLCGTLKRVVWYWFHVLSEHNESSRFLLFYISVVLWRGLYGTLKKVVCYFEEGCVVPWRGWCGTLKKVVWYFEEGGVVLWRMWCGTLKRAVLFFEEVGLLKYVFVFLIFQAIWHQSIVWNVCVICSNSICKPMLILWWRPLNGICEFLLYM